MSNEVKEVLTDAGKGLEYFKTPTDLQSKGEATFIRKFGLQGQGFILELKKIIFKENGYYCTVDEDLQEYFELTYGLEADEFNEMIAGAIKHKLFNSKVYEAYKVLTSAEIQSNYMQVIDERLRQKDNKAMRDAKRQAEKNGNSNHVDNFSVKHKILVEKNYWLIRSENVVFSTVTEEKKELLHGDNSEDTGNLHVKEEYSKPYQSKPYQSKPYQSKPYQSNNGMELLVGEYVDNSDYTALIHEIYEKGITDEFVLSEQVITGIICYYISEFERVTGNKHPKVSYENLIEIIRTLSEPIVNEDGVVILNQSDYDENYQILIYQDMIEAFLYANIDSDKKIFHFATKGILLNRYRETNWYREL